MGLFAKLPDDIQEVDVIIAGGMWLPILVQSLLFAHSCRWHNRLRRCIATC